VRWILTPTQPFEAAGAAPPDKNYLFAELITQIHRQPLRWQLIVIVGKPGDPTNDPSIGWPADREQVDVGTVVLDGIEAGGHRAPTGYRLRPAAAASGYGAFGRSGPPRPFASLFGIPHPTRQ